MHFRHILCRVYT